MDFFWWYDGDDSHHYHHCKPLSLLGLRKRIGQLLACNSHAYKVHELTDHVDWTTKRQNAERVVENAAAVEQRRRERENLGQHGLQASQSRSGRIGNLLIEIVFAETKHWNQRNPEHCTITPITLSSDQLSGPDFQIYWYMIIIDTDQRVTTVQTETKIPDFSWRNCTHYVKQMHIY